jgi:hypothetical protein
MLLTLGCSLLSLLQAQWTYTGFDASAHMAEETARLPDNLCYRIYEFVYTKAIVEFAWDERKNQANKRKHGVSFETASLVFDDPHHLARQNREVDGEPRWQTIGIETRPPNGRGKRSGAATLLPNCGGLCSRFLRDRESARQFLNTRDRAQQQQRCYDTEDRASLDARRMGRIVFDLHLLLILRYLSLLIGNNALEANDLLLQRRSRL